MLTACAGASQSAQQAATTTTYSGFNVAVQVHGYVVFANLTDSAVRQTNFSLATSTPEAVRASAMSWVPIEPNSLPSSPAVAVMVTSSSASCSAAFSRSFLVSGCFFQLGTTLFERSQVGGVGNGGLAEWQQEVTAVTSLNFYFVAQVAQVSDFSSRISSIW